MMMMISLRNLLRGMIFEAPVACPLVHLCLVEFTHISFRFSDFPILLSSPPCGVPPLVHLCPLASRLGREVLKISKYQTIIPWNPVPCAVVPCGVCPLASLLVCLRDFKRRLRDFLFKRLLRDFLRDLAWWCPARPPLPSPLVEAVERLSF